MSETKMPSSLQDECVISPPSSPPPPSPPDRPHLPLLRGGVLLQVVGHVDVQQGIVVCLLPPSVAGAEVGEGDGLAAEEDFHAVVELVESAGGEPEEFRKDCGADDRSLSGFNQSDWELRIEGEQVLSE